MLKKIICISCLSFLLSAHAETCPTVAELKMHQFNQWEATDFNSSFPASPEKTAQFVEKANRLDVVSWDFSQFGRCYYAGVTEQAEQLGVFLQKTVAPDVSRGNWRAVDPDSMVCEGAVEACEFVPENLQK